MESSLIRRARIAGGVLLLLSALATANYYFELHWLGERIDKAAMAMSFVVLGIFAFVIVPGLQAREHKKGQEAGYIYGRGIESQQHQERERAYPHTISASHSFFVKRLLPFITVVGLCAWSYWRDRDRGSSESIVFTLLAGTFFCAVLVFFLRRDLWKMADTVEDYGDHLVVTRWRTKADISLTAISQIELELGLSGFVVFLTLGQPCALGPVVCFFAPSERREPGASADLAALIKRVETAKAGTAAAPS